MGGEYYSEQCRRRKWGRVRFLHMILTRPPHRYHSLYRALENAPGLGYHISLQMFVMRMIAEYKFDRKLRIDKQLRLLYSCFEGAKVDAVDYRDILCCMTILRRFKEIMANPGKLFRDSILMYANEEGTLVCRPDALRVSRMGAIHEDEVMRTSGRLDRYLKGGAHSRDLKATFRELDMTFLMEAVESEPQILTEFRKQLWERLPNTWRLAILHAAEELGMEKALPGTIAVKLQRATRWYGWRLIRRMLIGWKAFKDISKRRGKQRAVFEAILRRQAIHKWHFSAATKALQRERYPIVQERGRHAVLRRFFKRLMSFSQNAKNISELTRAVGKQGRFLAAGMGLVRGVLRKRSMRRALYVWCELACLLSAWEFARRLHAQRLLRRVFDGFRRTVKEAVTQREAEQDIERRAAKITEAMERAEKDRMLLLEAAETTRNQRKAQAKSNVMQERAAMYQAQQKAALERSAARDNEILARQREERRRRVYDDRVRLRQQFEGEWKTRLEETVQADMEAAKDWLESGSKEAASRIQKELNALKRKFYAAPTPETAGQERALSNPANEIFARITHHLYEKGVALRELFQQYDEEGDGYLAYGEFKLMLTSLQIRITGEHLRSAIRAIDIDGSGFIDFPEMEAAFKQHEERKICGAAGSPWKMYVSPVHAIMVLHNVKTNVVIWDYKAKDRDLVPVVRDTIIGDAGAEARKRIALEQTRAWEQAKRERAAEIIQRQNRARLARKRRAAVRWKWDVERARRKFASDTAAATIIQCWWRVLRAEWLALRMLLITVEVLWDPESKNKYYFNHSLKDSTWHVPSILRRWKRSDARMGDVPEWVFISRLYGESYYVNTLSGTRSDQKPIGYVLCQTCKNQLACRKCKVHQQDLCFACYRDAHLKGDEACWHEWIPSSAPICHQCGQDNACVVCIQSDWNEPLCKRCWERTHSCVNSSHEHITVQEWHAFITRDVSVNAAIGSIYHDAEGAGFPLSYTGANQLGYLPVQ